MAEPPLLSHCYLYHKEWDSSPSYSIFMLLWCNYVFSPCRIQLTLSNDCRNHHHVILNCHDKKCSIKVIILLWTRIMSISFMQTKKASVTTTLFCWWNLPGTELFTTMVHLFPNLFFSQLQRLWLPNSTPKEPWITIFLFLGQNNWGEKDASLQAFLKFAFVACSSISTLPRYF